MARIVFVCDSAPLNSSDGLHLRVQNLVRELSSFNDCLYFGTGDRSRDETFLYELGFAKSYFVEPRPKSGLRWKRHFRLSNEKFLRISAPDHFNAVSDELRKAVNEWRCDGLISFAPALSEVGLGLALPKLIDYTDCQTLAYRRALKNRRGSLSLRETARLRLLIRRQAGRERALLRSYDLTTTISEADRQALLDVSGVSKDRVVVLQNGVAEHALSTGNSTRDFDRSIIFWGNLDFPPNWTAVSYFYEKVFMPFLSDKEIIWHIVGRGASKELQNKVSHPNICFHGFVDDLYEFAAEKGAMINPMVEGSGMKNKVVEAFALKIPVVSTRLGVEAIQGEDNVHFLVADSPEQFASQVQSMLEDEPLRRSIVSAGRELVESRYTWAAIGSAYQRLIENVMLQNGAERQSETA